MVPKLQWLEDPTVFRVNRLDAHSDHICYASKEELSHQSCSLRQNLDGQWLLHWSKAPGFRPADFWTTGFDDSGFDSVRVPGHLELQGYGIQLEHCLQCGAPLHGDRFYGVQGGVLCRICSHGQQGGSALTQEALAVLKAFSYIPMHRLGWVHISGEGRQSLEQYLELQLQQVLSWRLKSRDFLKNMNL